MVDRPKNQAKPIMDYPLDLGMRAVEYSGCISTEGVRLSSTSLGYDIKPFDDKAPVNGALGNMEYPFIASRSTLTRSGSIW